MIDGDCNRVERTWYGEEVIASQSRGSALARSVEEGGTLYLGESRSSIRSVARREGGGGGAWREQSGDSAGRSVSAADSMFDRGIARSVYIAQ